MEKREVSSKKDKLRKNAKIAVRTLKISSLTVLAGFAVSGIGSFLYYEYKHDNIPNISNNDASIIKNIELEKKDFVKNNTFPVRDLINYRLNASKEQKTEVYNSVISNASKNLKQVGNSYEFYYRVAKEFSNAEQKYGVTDYNVNDYFMDFLGEKWVAPISQNVLDIRKNFDDKKNELMKHMEVTIDALGENSFRGVGKISAKNKMNELVIKIINSGADKNETIAALLTQYYILQIGEADPSYYLESQQNDELLNVIQKSIEQNRILLATEEVSKKN